MNRSKKQADEKEWGSDLIKKQQERDRLKSILKLRILRKQMRGETAHEEQAMLEQLLRGY